MRTNKIFFSCNGLLGHPVMDVEPYFYLQWFPIGIPLLWLSSRPHEVELEASEKHLHCTASKDLCIFFYCSQRKWIKEHSIFHAKYFTQENLKDDASRNLQSMNSDKNHKSYGEYFQFSCIEKLFALRKSLKQLCLFCTFVYTLEFISMLLVHFLPQ